MVNEWNEMCQKEMLLLIALEFHAGEYQIFFYIGNL